MPDQINKNNNYHHCILDVLHRVEKSTTTKEDADYLLAILIRTNTKISELESRLHALTAHLH